MVLNRIIACELKTYKNKLASIYLQFMGYEAKRTFPATAHSCNASIFSLFV